MYKAFLIATKQPTYGNLLFSALVVRKRTHLLTVFDTYGAFVAFIFVR